jgi:hypothetical protein
MFFISTSLVELSAGHASVQQSEIEPRVTQPWGPRAANRGIVSARQRHGGKAELRQKESPAEGGRAPLLSIFGWIASVDFRVKERPLAFFIAALEQSFDNRHKYGRMGACAQPWTFRIRFTGA